MGDDSQILCLNGLINISFFYLSHSISSKLTGSNLIYNNTCFHLHSQREEIFIHNPLWAPISPGNGLFETHISPIQWATSLLYTYTALILDGPIFETLIFVITIQKQSSYSPVSSTFLMQLQQIQPNHVHPHPSRKSSLRDAPTSLIPRVNPSHIRLYVSSNGRTSLRDTHFCNKSTKINFIITHSQPHFCIFITNQIFDLPSQRR